LSQLTSTPREPGIRAPLLRLARENPRWRRLVRDHERLPATREAMVK
jgi:hypothetical protein